MSLCLIVTLGRCSLSLRDVTLLADSVCSMGTTQHFLEIAVVFCLQHWISIVSLFNFATDKFKSELLLPFTTLDFSLKHYNNNCGTESCVTICCVIYEGATQKLLTQNQGNRYYLLHNTLFFFFHLYKSLHLRFALTCKIRFI